MPPLILFFRQPIIVRGTSQVALVVKNTPANARDVKPINVGLIPGLGRSPGEGMATHSSILAWRIPWTEESDGLKHMESQRVGHYWATNTFTFQSWKNCKKPQFSSCKEASHWLGPILIQDDLILLWLNPQRLHFQTRSPQPPQIRNAVFPAGPRKLIPGICLEVFHCSRMLRCLSHVPLFAALWTVSRQAPLSMGFSRQEYWSGLPCLPPWDLPDPGSELRSPKMRCFLPSTTGRPLPRPQFHSKPKENIKWKKKLYYFVF